MPRTISREAARRYLLSQLGLAQPSQRTGAAGVRAMLEQLRVVQLDPLDPMGTNADLVAAARVDGLKRGDVYAHLLPGHAFEHFAKERCLLPASAFRHYRQRALVTPWWRTGDRLERVSAEVVDAVLEEVRRRGPCSPAELTDHGRVAPIDWAGWKGTARATNMALEILWARCDVVVAGRSQRSKLYATPEAAFPAAVHGAPPGEEAFERWALRERAEACGLLSRAAGPWWSSLSQARTSGLPETLVRNGVLEEVRIEGADRPYLAPARFSDRKLRERDDRMRILGPLDPLIWDRKLVSLLFGFDYVWEVYKPASQRKFGWYVCPLLHEGQLVGRLEARVQGASLVVSNLWKEPKRKLDLRALDAALARHAQFCGVDWFERPARPTVA